MLAALLRQLCLNQVGEMTNRMHGLKLGSLKLYVKHSFDGHDQVDVIERIPLGDIGCRKPGPKHEVLVVKQITENLCELRVDFFLLHGFSIARTLWGLPH